MRYLIITTAFVCISLLSFGQKYKHKNVVDHWENVISPKDTFYYFPGTTEPDTDWYKPSYKPSWSKGFGGFGFGDNDDTTVISSSATSIYIIRKFNIKDTSKIYNALLTLDYDDGFVAFLNGVEIARNNIGKLAHPPHDSLAWSSHEAQMYQGGQPEFFYIQKSLLNNILINGDNYLCIQVHNVSASSNDLTCIPYFFVAINDTTSKNYRSNPSWFAPNLVTHLPIIVINTNGQGIPDDPSITVDMGIIDNGFDQNHYKVDSFNEYNGKIKIQTRGSSSQGQPQKSYSWTTVDTAGNNDGKKILGLPKESDWTLFGPYTDKTLMRNNLIYEISRKMGWYASRTVFVELILNDQYQGVYVVMEKIKWDPNRVNVPKILSTTTKGDSLTGGYVLKVDRVKQSGYGIWHSPISNYNGSKDYYIQTVNPDIPNITQTQTNYIKKWMDSFENMLYGTGYGSKLNTNYRKFIDVNSFIDFYICNEVTHNVDAYRLSCYLYKQKNSLGGKLYAGPIWDFNIALGNANYCNGGDTTGWSTCAYSAEPFWFDRLLEDPDYQKQFKCRWTALRKDILKTTTIHNWIDSVAQVLEVPQRRHFKQWQILGTYVWPNNYIGQTYAQEINYLKNWIRGRMNWMDKNMPNVSSTCKSQSATSLYISEINYNSHPKLDGGNWIELYNSSISSLSISGYTLTDASGFRSYTVPNNTSIAGRSYIVLVEDTALFRKAYPNVKNYKGPFGWSLPNDTGTIRMYDATNYLIVQMGYSDKKAWPQGADGRGYTLELKAPGNDPNNPTSWMDGCIGGSPGKARINCNEKLVISEINYSSEKNHDAGDWFELHNLDTVPYSLKGYYIKDDNDTDIFTITSNISIPGKGYLVVCNDTTKFKSVYPSVTNYIGQFNYGLNAKGDAVRIYNGFGTPIQKVEYLDSLPFPYGAKGTGYTIEYYDSAVYQNYGSSWQLSCYLGSPGRERPKFCFPGQYANLAVTEYKLTSDTKNKEGQWFEIYNRDSLSLDISYWKLKNSANNIIYTFPAKTIISSHGYLMVCNDTAAFKKAYPTAKNYVGNFNYQIKTNWDSINLYDNIDYFTKAFVSQYQYYDRSNMLTRSVELLHPDSSDLDATNWTDGCLYATPEMPRTICSEPNYISEINYNSVLGDWLELYNPQSSTVDYSGYEIRINQDSVLLPQGTSLQSKEYLSLISDSLHFLNHIFIRKYIHQPPLNLNDTLGIVKIYDASQKLVYSNIYRNTLPFDTLANNYGYTLHLISDTLNPEDPASWRSSCMYGTPNMAIDAPCGNAMNTKIAFNEISLWPDPAKDDGAWIELYNKDTLAANLSNWAIMNGRNTILLRFPENYTLYPNSYIILCNDSNKFKRWHQNTPYLYMGNISLSSDYLVLVDDHYTLAAEALYDKDSLPLPAKQFGHTLNNATSHSHLLLNTSWNVGRFDGTPGALNQTTTDTLVVSEINYNNAATKDAGDWLELYNPNMQTMHLGGAYIRNQNISSWIQLPNNTDILPDSFVVLTADTALYNSRNGIFQSHIMYLPSLQLDNDSDVIFIYNKDSNLIYSNYYEYHFVPTSHGLGYTMEHRLDTPMAYTPSKWFAGCEEGSPGFRYTVPCPLRVKPVSVAPTHMENEVNVYPNPAHHILYIQLNAHTFVNASIKIYDLNGKLIHEQKAYSDVISLNTTLWSEGLYILNINGKSVKKFAVSK